MVKGDVVYNDDFQVESGMWEKFTKKKENGLIKHFTYYGKKKKLDEKVPSGNLQRCRIFQAIGFKLWLWGFWSQLDNA